MMQKSLPADRCSTSLQAIATLEKIHPIFIVEHDVIPYGMSLQSVRVSSPRCVPPNLLPTPKLFTGETEGETEKALMLCKPCSTIAKTLGCYQHFFGHQSKTQHNMGCYEENVLNPSQTQYPVPDLLQNLFGIAVECINIQKTALISLEKSAQAILLSPQNSQQ